MTEQPIRTTFSLSWKDYYNGSKIWLKLRPASRYFRWFAIFLLGTAALLGFWANGIYEQCEFEGTTDRILWFLKLNLVSIFLLIYTVLYASGVLGKIWFWAYFRRVKLAGVERTWEFTSETAKCTFAQGESNIKWDYFSSWGQDNNYIVIIHDRRLCYPFPKRAFASTADIEKLIAILKEKIPMGKK